MLEYQKDQRIYLQSEQFTNTHLVSHGFTGRTGGVSSGKITGLTVGSDGQMRWNRNPAGRYVIYAIPDGKSPAQAKDPSGMNYRPQYIVGVSYTNSYVLPDWLWDGYRYAVAPYDRFGNEWPATLAE